MHKKNAPYSCIPLLLLLLLLSACGNTKHPPGSDIASTPEQLEEKVTGNIRQLLEYAAANKGRLNDSVPLFNAGLVKQVYDKNQFAAVWSSKEQWNAQGDSILQLVSHAKLYGLFPRHYYYSILDSINQQFLQDSLSKSARRDAALWSTADVLLTNAFFHIIKDVKLGRLPNDSISLRKDTVLTDQFYIQQLEAFQKGNSLSSILEALEPQHEGYQLLKAGISKFLDSADYKQYTKLPSSKDAGFKALLQKRLLEGGYLANDSTQADSLELAEAVKKFQKQKNITVDGKAGEGTIRMLNTSDEDKFYSIAITMDRYKMLPPTMPERYIWVNLPSFSMKVQDKDSVKLTSKIVCGKAITRTPVLNSAVSEIITYPQWTVPTSIIVKEILPAVKRNPGYLAKKGFSLVDKNGEEVDPYTVDWSKYSKGIPYRVVQGSGDANALGVLKFNFPNKYAVYLHDTNQRSLFGQVVRTFSHGCVRVQEWQKLADYIIRKDRQEVNGKVALLDSMGAWLKRKEKHSIPVKNRLPVYIRYFTCEGKPGGIAFYDDIYGEDKMLRQRYFAAGPGNADKTAGMAEKKVLQ
ncbi:MAG: L,D-transpeptidase family protein [Chitinophagaceae bacterium]|nr:L,D-transpeptidase family protein [Chitinophagaceae bacterium]